MSIIGRLFPQRPTREQEIASVVQDVLSKGGLAAKGTKAEPKSWELDPHDWRSMLSDMGLDTPQHQGTSGLSYDVLRQMARVPLISAIINTRINQIAEFSVPQDSPYSLGYKIALRDPKQKPSRAAEKKIEEYTRWFQTCGDPLLSYDDRFETFIRKIARDSIILDQCCFEVIPTRGGKIAGMVAVDAATIRRAAISQKELDQGRREWGKTGYVQIIASRITTSYTPDELVFGIRRPRTAISMGGYGYPELEELVRVISNLLNAESYNAANFQHGMHAAGILALKSKMSPQLFRAFRREFYAMLSGAHNAHKTPIIQLDPEAKEELQNVNMSSTNKEMEYSQWLSFLLRQACMVFQIDPAELGYQFGNEGQQSAMGNSNVGEKIAYSRERGLRPMLRAMQSWLNTGLMWRIDEDFELIFAGFDSKSEKDRLDMDIQAVTNFKTINEVREGHDLKPLDSPVGDMIMNASFMQTASMMAQQSEDGGEFPGGDGELPPGGDAPEDGAADSDTDIDALFADSDYDFAGDDGEEKPEAVKKALVKSITVEVS